MTEKDKKIENKIKDEEEKIEELDKSENEKEALDEEMSPEKIEVEMVTIPLKSMEEQLKEIDELKEKVKEYSDGWQRERAEFENYRKRVVRDRDQEKQNITVEIIKKYLVVNDDLALAMKNAPDSKENQQWVNGIELILKKLDTILDAEGIEPIQTDKEFFDPQFHEAISHEDNPDFESGQIIEVVKQGYKINNRIIRPALVRVAK